MQTYNIKDMLSRLTLQQFWVWEACAALKGLNKNLTCMQKGQALFVNKSLWHSALLVKGGRRCF